MMVGSREQQNFNPRSPWGERHAFQLFPHWLKRFQSTLPVGGATRSPAINASLIAISIHAPRGGSDHRGTAWMCGFGHFNPRSPWGERPY